MTRHEQAWAKWEKARTVMTPRQLDYIERRITSDRVNAEIDRAWEETDYIDEATTLAYLRDHPEYPRSLRELMGRLVCCWKRGSGNNIHRYAKNADGSRGRYLGETRSSKFQ